MKNRRLSLKGKNFLETRSNFLNAMSTLRLGVFAAFIFQIASCGDQGSTLQQDGFAEELPTPAESSKERSIEDRADVMVKIANSKSYRSMTYHFFSKVVPAAGMSSDKQEYTEEQLFQESEIEFEIQSPKNGQETPNQVVLSKIQSISNVMEVSPLATLAFLDEDLTKIVQQSEDKISVDFYLPLQKVTIQQKPVQRDKVLDPIEAIGEAIAGAVGSVFGIILENFLTYGPYVTAVDAQNNILVKTDFAETVFPVLVDVLVEEPTKAMKFDFANMTKISVENRGEFYALEDLNKVLNELPQSDENSIEFDKMVLLAERLKGKPLFRMEFPLK